MITGSLTEQIEILIIGYSANTLGVQVPFYTPIKKIWVSSMNQNVSAGYDQGVNITDRVTFYSRFDNVFINNRKGLYIKYNDQLYTVVGVSPVRRKEAIIINCEAVE